MTRTVLYLLILYSRFRCLKTARKILETKPADYTRQNDVLKDRKTKLPVLGKLSIKLLKEQTALSQVLESFQLCPYQNAYSQLLVQFRFKLQTLHLVVNLPVNSIALCLHCLSLSWLISAFSFVTFIHLKYEVCIYYFRRQSEEIRGISKLPLISACGQFSFIC